MVRGGDTDLHIGKYFITRFSDYEDRRLFYPDITGGGGGGGRVTGKFIIEKIIQNECYSFGYEDNQKKQLIEKVWGWLHENKELEIKIRKNTQSNEG